MCAIVCVYIGVWSPAASRGLSRKYIQVLPVQHASPLLSHVHELHTR